MSKPRKLAAWEHPVYVGWCHDGWRLVELKEDTPTRFGVVDDWIFERNDGNRATIRTSDQTTLNVGMAKEQLFHIVWYQHDQELAREYARMC